MSTRPQAQGQESAVLANLVDIGGRNRRGGRGAVFPDGPVSRKYLARVFLHVVVSLNVRTFHVCIFVLFVV